MADIDRKETKRVTKWENELKSGREFREKIISTNDVEKYKKMYRGDWKKTILPVNRIFSYGRSMIPRVYFRSPTITITPRTPQKAMHARVVETLINWLIYEINLKYTMKRSALDGYYAGTGPIKLGFDSEFGYIPEQATGENDGKTATRFGVKSGADIEYNANVKRGMPWAISIPSQDVIVPWGFRDGWALPWICHEFVRPAKDVRQDQKYNSNRKKVKGGFVRDNKRSLSGIQPYRAREGQEFCLLQEIRTVRTKEILVICEGMLLLEEKDELQIEGLPWEFVQYNPDPDWFWAIPDVRMLEPQQLELNEIRTQASRHRRLALIKFLYLAGSLEEDELNKLLGEHLGPGIKVNGDNVEAAIKILQPHIPPDLWQEAQEMLGDFRETMGFSRNQAGEFAGRRTPPTATESQIVQAGSEIRVDERRDIMADVLVSISRKFLQMIFKFWTAERLIKVVGPQGAELWLKYTGDELKGEYDFRLDPDSGLPVTRGLRYQQAEKLFGMLATSPYVDQQMLHKMLLRQFEWIDPSWQLILNPSQNPNMPMVMPGMPPPGGQKGGGQGPGRPVSIGEGSKNK
jgi:hypothetical protein